MKAFSGVFVALKDKRILGLTNPLLWFYIQSVLKMQYFHFGIFCHSSIPILYQQNAVS